MAPLSGNKGIHQTTQITTTLTEITNKAVSKVIQATTTVATTGDTTPATFKDHRIRMVQPWDTTKAGDSSTNTDIQEVTPRMISSLNL